MAGASNETSVEYIYKRKYSDRQVADMTMRDHARYASIEKRDDYEGDSYNYSMKYGNPQGTGADFATALAAVTSSKGKKLSMTERTRYGFISLGGTAMLKARRKGDGAFLELVSTETDGIIRTMGQDNAHSLYRNGSGARGRILSINGNVLQLANIHDAIFFQEGMELVGDNNAAGTSANAGSCDVTKVNRRLGQVTVSTVASANLIVDDYLFKSADAGGSTCFDGLDTLIPLTAPSSGESFRGIDRTADVEMLAGIRIDDSSETLENNIGLAMIDMMTWATEKNRIKFYAHPRKVFDIARRGNGKVSYDDAGGTLSWGFQKIEVVTSYGTVPVIADPDCPYASCWGVSEADEVLHTLGEVVHVIRDDGQKFIRLGTSDGIRMDVRSSGNTAIYRPAAFAVLSVG